ncbi:MAG: adenosine deaminase family protein [Anaerolineaceae bacterium]|nr:adenosine deaminase family protein [Anaerolineaceae bacterium]
MSVESFIRAMPKAELHIHLEGAIRLETLRVIAEQNDIPETLKRYADWLDLVENPDYSRLDEIVQAISQWLQTPDDLSLMAYELGVFLAKQNVKYAEVHVNPVLYIENGFSFEQFITAISDGRDRAQRGWGIRMVWILTMTRDNPRRSDDILRWASSAAGRKVGVIGVGLSGPEDAQPIGQFERAFRNAEKKELPLVTRAGDVLGAEGILEIIETAHPSRLMDGWGSADAPDALHRLRDDHIPLDICIARQLCLGHLESYAAYPLRQLYDEGIILTVNSDLPSFYKTTLNDEYLAVVEHCDFALGEVEELALNAVRSSLLPDDERTALLASFQAAYTILRNEHLTSAESAP